MGSCLLVTASGPRPKGICPRPVGGQLGLRPEATRAAMITTPITTPTRRPPTNCSTAPTV